METFQSKYDNESDDYYLKQRIPNQISSKELYCEKDLGVNNFKFILRQPLWQYNTTKESY